MKVCVVGAGAIGGFLGVKLALSGQDVTLVARGAHLQAIRENGLELHMNDGTRHLANPIRATDDLSEVGPQDVVVLGLKAHQIAPVAADMRALFGPRTVVMTTQNGIPWWYFHRHGGPFEGHNLRCCDPDGLIAANIEAERVIGCIAYPATEIVRPGVIRHVEGIRFPVGELDGTQTERVGALSQMLIDAGFKSPVLTDFRSELWLKLWGNLSFNPISALTHSTLVDICQFPLSRELARTMMTEAQDVAHKLGVTFRVPLEKRIAGAERVGKHKTSMLQDLEQGKAMEIDSMMGAVVELGALTDTPTPAISTLYACVKLLARTVAEEGIRVQGQPLALPSAPPPPLHPANGRQQPFSARQVS